MNTLQPTLNAKIFLTLLASLTLFVLLIFHAHTRYEDATRQAIELNDAEHALQTYLALGTYIEATKRHVLNYALTGDEDSVLAVESLREKFQASLQRVPAGLPGEIAGIVDNLKEHHRGYLDAFAVMRTQRPVQERLRQELRDAARQIRTLLDVQAAIAGREAVSARLLIALTESERGVVRYYETYDRRYADKALTTLKHSETLAGQFAPPTLLDALSRYRQITVRSLQHFRAYQMLDVVLAGEAHEMIYYAQALRQQAREASAGLAQRLRDTMHDSSRNLLLSALLFIAAMLLSSWGLLHVVVTPLRRMTKTFEALADSTGDVDIPAYTLDDDIGKLTRAAQAFEEKNHQTRRLLIQTEALAERLRLSEHRLRIASESGHVGVWDYDITSGYLLWDETMYRLFGIDPAKGDATYAMWRTALKPEALEAAEAELQRCIDGHLKFDAKFPIVRPSDGEERIIKAYADTFYDEQGTPTRMIGINYDITESERLTRSLEERVSEEIAKRREQEQVLIQQSKLAAMGEMISAIAHQWRQPLNAIALYLQDLVSAEESGELDRAYLQTGVQRSMEQVNHMSQTIEDFRNFFRPASEDQDFDIPAVLSDTLELYTAQLANNDIQCTLNPAENETFEYRGNANHLRQVILNLLSNAIDAIKERKQAEPGCRGRIELTLRHADGAIRIAIADNGSGLSPRALEHLYEPYFTTKEQGKGSGIGLYMSRTILRNYFNADMRHQALEQGTEVTITLPEPSTPAPKEENRAGS